MVVRLSAGQAPDWVSDRLAGLGGTRWIGVDGLGAAGKTTLAAAIAARLEGAVVVHIDDFARPGVRGWERGRFVTQVLAPLLAGRSACYQRWDYVADVGREWFAVPPGVPVVVEGVSATDVRVKVPWDVRLWVEADPAQRRRRILARDDPDLLERWTTDWWPSEQAYVAQQRPAERVDAIVAMG